MINNRIDIGEKKRNKFLINLKGTQNHWIKPPDLFKY
jgi:hypothetical protein